MQNIHYFPGHHTKTRRQMVEDIKLVDIVVELVDARIPMSSRNPDLDELVGMKPRLVVLNRVDQADPEMNQRWSDYFRARGIAVMETDSKEGTGVNRFAPVIKETLKDKIQAYQEKGLVGRPIRAMIVGVPNVGKSTFINKVAKRKSAKAGNKPGVTRGKQWVTIDQGLELLDTPGILWPKFEDQLVAHKLAYTGAIKDEVVDLELLAYDLMDLLAHHYPDVISARYKIQLPDAFEGWEVLELAARKRGFLISGGEVDRERMAKVLLDEYRSGKLGRFTLETPEEFEHA